MTDKIYSVLLHQNNFNDYNEYDNARVRLDETLLNIVEIIEPTNQRSDNGVYIYSYLTKFIDHEGNMYLRNISSYPRVDFIVQKEILKV